MGIYVSTPAGVVFLRLDRLREGDKEKVRKALGVSAEVLDLIEEVEVAPTKPGLLNRLKNWWNS